MSTMNPSVQIDELVFQKIMYWCNKADTFEVSGLGNVIYDPETNIFHVNEAYLLQQENTGTTTDLDEKAIGKLMYEHHKSQIPGELRFWWHSHANMPVFWSGTDITTIKELSKEGWFLSTVFNRKEEMRSAFHMTDPMTVFADDLSTTIMQQFQDKDMEKHLAKMGLQVRKDKMADIRWAVEPLLSQQMKAAWDKEYDEKVTEGKYERISRFPPNYVSRTYNFPSVLKDSDNESLLQNYPFSKESFPDYISRNSTPAPLKNISEEEKDEALEDIEEFITAFPNMTREELIETFEAEYPFVRELIHPNFKGLQNG